MPTTDWLLADGRRASAVGRIHRAARELFLERGIERTTADAVARRAGCSRATFYRLVGSRAALVDALLAAGGAAVVARVEEATAGLDGADRATEAVVTAAAAIRADRVLTAWLRDRGSLDDVLGGPQGSAAIARSLTGIVGAGDRDGEWIVRSVLALVAMPGRDADAERELVARYVVPPLGLTPG
ncbi:TetR/AcrR family transcriptional regulator [Nocardioides nitrophenolicus]|uniref:TetR/AcrR family transcriptional regulator n=1 Tax=Nocardioides nitrophenolicus TaxID=60489 RepID=UPI00195B5401|nr:helix-turn-helix domain-containing protein [Nocardioides nitrophenolicus]MBM7520333.1 AcrR family transcriptional regulator [Nocardioides nitrophenolicus]